MRGLCCVMVAVSAAALVFVKNAAVAQGTPPGSEAATAATSTPATDTPAPEKGKAAPKKKKPAKMSRQQEIDRSIERGTVPARYRSSVPREYQQYIPFDRR